MEFLNQAIKTNLVYMNTSGSTSVEYSNYVDMVNYGRVDFYVTAAIQLTSANVGAINRVNMALYEASAATVTAPSAITSATAVMGMTTAKQISGVAEMTLTFATIATAVAGATFDINGNQFLSDTGGQSTSTSGAFTSAITGSTDNGTIISELFATYFNATYYNTTGAIEMRKHWYCSTAGPACAVVVLKPKDGGATTLTATGTSAVAPGFKMIGHVGIGAEKMSTNCKYVCIALNSCTTKVPLTAIAVRSQPRFMPAPTALAVTKNL